MGALSYNQGRDLTKAAVNVLQKLELAAASNSPNYDGLYDTLIAANLGDLQGLLESNFKAHRNALSSMLSPEFCRAVLSGPLAEWAVACGAPERIDVLAADFALTMDRLRDNFVANTRSLNAREGSYGAASAGGSNTGNGTISRLTVDEDGFALEGGHAEVKTFTCIQDQQNVEKHFEVFRVDGGAAEPDFVKYLASGRVLGIRGLTTRDSEAYLTNPAFNQYGGTTQPSAGSEQVFTSTTALTGWTVTTAANAYISLGPSDTNYRNLVGETNKYAVKFTGNNAMSQQLNSFKRPSFDRRSPYFKAIAVYRGSSCDGTLTIRMGATTRAVSMSSLSAGWNFVTLTMDKNLYHKNFTTNDAVVSYTLASWTTGYLYLSGVILSPMAFMDGSWWAMVGGSTPFKSGDTFTVTDSYSATRGIMSYWIHHRTFHALEERTRGFCLPVNAAAGETVTDPS